MPTILQYAAVSPKARSPITKCAWRKNQADHSQSASEHAGYETIASGDSFNDLGMIKASKQASCSAPPNRSKLTIRRESCGKLRELMAEIKKVMGIK